MCAQYIILGACVVAFVLVSLGAAWGAAIGVWVRLRIIRGAWQERTIVERGTERLRREFALTLDALRAARARLSAGQRPG